MMASKGWRVVQVHIPMIKFRKGTIDRAVGGAVATSQSAGSGPALAKPAKVGSGPGVVSRPLIEDYQLPPRYQRRPLDINEIDYINRGGPE